MGGKWTPERKAKHAEKMRAWHAGLSPEEKARRAGLIGSALKGKTRTEEQNRRNSEAQQGKRLSDEHREKIAGSMRIAYMEGRKQPVRSSHRKGKRHTEESRRKMSESLQGREVWNKGLKTGPRPLLVRQKISESMRGRPHQISPEKYDAWRRAIGNAKRGTKASLATRRKMSETHRRAWANGEREVPAKSGYGIGSHYDSPLQGKVWLRSTSEVQRARELDAEGVLWLYEAVRYTMHLKDVPTTYCPDFWVLPNFKGDVLDPKEFLASYAGLVLIEDVKGWWGPKHKTYPKIQAFQEQYPEFNFSIVVRGGLL